MKNFNGRPFFSLFFIARVNQKIRILALGRHSIWCHLWCRALYGRATTGVVSFIPQIVSFKLRESCPLHYEFVAFTLRVRVIFLAIGSKNATINATMLVTINATINATMLVTMDATIIATIKAR
jgi:hypothetical protein